MADETTEKDVNKALFTSLVMMLASSAMQQLGKLVNPITDKTEVNLQGVQVTIDMLVMLQEKMSGNLDEYEQKMLDDTVSSLQMNYVETRRAESSHSGDQKTEGTKPEEQASGAEDEPPTSGDESPTERADDRTQAKDGEKKTPKFHKSYGDE